MINNEKISFLRRAFKSIRQTPELVNVEVSCPNPKCKSHKTSKLKLIIQVETQQFNCWVCGVSGVGVSKLANKYFPHLASESARVFGRFDKKNLPKEQQVDFDLELPKEFVFLGENFDSKDPDIKRCIKYAKSRGLSDRDIWYFKLCAVPTGRFRNRIIMPSFDQDGSLNYYVTRSIFKDSKMKYINSKVPKKNIIFNEINIKWDKELTLVEGPFDLTKANENSTCLLGCSLKEEQTLFKKIVKNNTPICLALDPDVKQKAIKIATLLSSYGIQVRMLDVNGYDDVGEMTKEQFLQRQNEAKLFGRDQKLLELISSIKSGSLV